MGCPHPLDIAFPSRIEQSSGRQRLVEGIPNRWHADSAREACGRLYETRFVPLPRVCLPIYSSHGPCTDVICQSNEDGLEAERPPLELVASDGALAIIAGSDTAATALSQTFYFLLRHPECMKKLRGEIESVYPGSTDPLLDFGKQAEMPYLNACMYVHSFCYSLALADLWAA